MWKVEFLLRPDKCLWIGLGLTPSLLLLRGFLFLFIDGPRGMSAAWSWKILPVETIPGEESLKSRDIPQERLSYSKHTYHANTNKHEHNVLISSRSLLVYRPRCSLLPFISFLYIFILIHILVCLKSCITIIFQVWTYVSFCIRPTRLPLVV